MIFLTTPQPRHISGYSVSFGFCSFCFLTGWVCPGKDILAPVLVASHFFPNRISEGLVMWGEQNQQLSVTCCLLFTWRGSECVHVFETDITSRHLIPRMHTCRNVGDTCTGLDSGLCLFSLALSPLLP